MGLFDFFRNKKENNELKSNLKDIELDLKLKPYLLDNMIYCSLPIEWQPYESDRFRAKHENGKAIVSIKNFVRQANDIQINADFFRDLKLALFDQFVIESEYEPYDDLTVKDDFISKSFKVDDETQYYCTTARSSMNQLYLTEIIIRHINKYSAEMRALSLVIKDSIKLNA